MAIVHVWMSAQTVLRKSFTLSRTRVSSPRLDSVTAESKGMEVGLTLELSQEVWEIGLGF